MHIVLLLLTILKWIFGVAAVVFLALWIFEYKFATR